MSTVSLNLVQGSDETVRSSSEEGKSCPDPFGDRKMPSTVRMWCPVTSNGQSRAVVEGSSSALGDPAPGSFSFEERKNVRPAS